VTKTNSDFKCVKSKKNSYVKILDGKGLCSLQVGLSTYNDVVREFGKVHKFINHNKYSIELQYKEKGLSFYYRYYDTNKTISSIRTYLPFKGKTLKGIILGKSTLKDVVAKHGSTSMKWLSTEDSSTWWFEYPGIEFHVKRNSFQPDNPFNKSDPLNRKIIEIHVEKIPKKINNFVLKILKKNLAKYLR